MAVSSLYITWGDGVATLFTDEQSLYAKPQDAYRNPLPKEALFTYRVRGAYTKKRTKFNKGVLR